MGWIDSSLLHDYWVICYRAVSNGQCLVRCGVCVGVKVQGGIDSSLLHNGWVICLQGCPSLFWDKSA